MQKIILILALAMLYNSNAGAKDRDCVRYTAEEAKEAIGESESTSFSAVFTHAAGRIGNTNTGCLASDSPYVAEDVPASAKYGNRLLMIDATGASDNYNIRPYASRRAVWYQVNPDGEDIEVGRGAYIASSTGDPLPTGSYYAVITDGDNQYKTDVMSVQTDTDPSNFVFSYAAEPYDIETVAKWGDRLLVVNLKAMHDEGLANFDCDDEYGCDVNTHAQNFTWYKVNPNGGDDISVGTGVYLTDPNGEPLAAGSYYAVYVDGDTTYRSADYTVTSN